MSPAPKSQVVTVLGMHRSGTSCLAGSLQVAGLYAGEVVDKGGRRNMRGNRENLEIVGINKAVLKASGGNWNKVPSELVWTKGQARRRDELIDRFAAESPVWTFKDPRTTVTLPFWQEAPIDLHVVGIFRHPAKVARSLHSRSGMPAAEGLKLWTDYNRVLVDLHRDHPLPLLSFDTTSSEFEGQLRRTIDFLHERLDDGPELSLEAASSFYAPQLIHQAEQSPPVLEDGDEDLDEVLAEAEGVYDELRERSLIASSRAGDFS